MPSLPPLVIPGFIVLAVVFTGAVIAFLRDRARFRGYEDLTNASLRLGKVLHGEVFRDGEDLVVNGTWDDFPVQVRASHAENTPGINIRMGAPVTCSLLLAPKIARAKVGRYVLKTTDEMFNARVDARSDRPTEASLLLGTAGVVPALSKICRSSQTFFRVGYGVLELNELAPPSSQAISELPSCLHALSTIARASRKLPGAEAVRVEPLKGESRIFVRTVIAAGVLATVFAVMLVLHPPDSRIPVQAAAPKLPEGVLPMDAPLLPDVTKCTLATAEDFNRDDEGWLRGNQVQVRGRISLGLSSPGADDHAYVLKTADGKKRVALIAHAQNVYDAKFPYVGIAARVPKEILSTIKWAGLPPDNPDGDGLLIVRAPSDRTSGIIIFLKGDRIISAAPQDYLSIRLE